ncbi:MAG TPA: GNAT family N-acetyltransferase [Candidatus Saccharimonadales bacterium]|nr:GNAT family N-acetyltransferase [Candidatus Saccharimonadales bacterium]
MAGDLAGGDARSAALDVSGLEVTRIVSKEDPGFETCYDKLWQEFGSLHEMEGREVIEQRLQWFPAAPVGKYWLRYEMALVRERGKFVAARDQTAIVAERGGGAEAVVHMSHVLVDPSWRRTGLAGWLRAWPLQTARACLQAAGYSPTSPITLVAEMEHPSSDAQVARLRAYEKAGFKTMDRRLIHYLQPDFRSPAEIDDSGGPRPLAFGLVLRRVGREHEATIRGAEARRIVESLYQMYGTTFRAKDMAAVYQTLASYPADEAEIPLVQPTK